MRSSLFRKQLKEQANGTGSSGAIFSLDNLRSKILTSTLLVFLIAGFAVFFISLPGMIQQRKWIVIVCVLIVLGWLLTAVLLPRMGFRIKAISLVLAIALVGQAVLLSRGLNGSGLLFLLAVPVMTVLLFGVRSSIQVLILILVVFAITGFMLAKGIIPGASHANAAAVTPLVAWVEAGASLALAGATISLSIGMILRSLGANSEKEKRLIGELDIERTRQEHRVLQRTQDLEHRLEQIRASAEIIHTIGLYLRPEQFLPKIVDLLQERFHYYFIGVYLLDERNEFVVLHAGSGDAGAQMVEAGHRLAVDEASVAGWSILHQQTKVAVDVGFEAVRFNNPLLPLTRSELALPLLVSSERGYPSVNRKTPIEGDLSTDLDGHLVLGAMVVQSAEARAFDQEDINMLQGIADALAAALDNARLLLRLEQSLNEIQTLHRQYLLEAWKDISLNTEIRQSSSDSRHASSSDSWLEPGGTEISYPIRLRDQAIGQLTLNMGGAELTDEENALIDAVTTQAAVALENVRLLEKNQQQVGYEKLLSEISRKARSSTDLDTILRITLNELGQVLGATDGEIRLEIPSGKEEVQS